MNDSPDPPVWFVGDLSDPWVVSIAEGLAACAGIMLVHCPGDLPVCPFSADQLPRLIVIHRQRITRADIQRLKEYRASPRTSESPAIFMCVSPYVRYEDLERSSPLVDLVISEATAADILPRHVRRLVEKREGRSPGAAPASFRIEVAGSNHDLRGTLVESCATAGYNARQVADLAPVGDAGPTARATIEFERTLTVWDVPVLEPGWSQRLELRSKQSGPVIALFGFADRETVMLAKASGAAACLDLPCHVDDLIDVIDRVARSLPADRWPTPVRTEQPHRLPPPPRRRTERRDRPVHAPPWSDRDGKPTV